MKITLKIDDGIMSDLLRITGGINKRKAVVLAVTGFVYRKQAREFGRMIREGLFDYPTPATDAAGHDCGNPLAPLNPA
jgi:hypothetical protein